MEVGFVNVAKLLVAGTIGPVFLFGCRTCWATAFWLATSQEFSKNQAKATRKHLEKTLTTKATLSCSE